MTLQSTPAWARILASPEITDRNVLRAMFSRSGAARFGDFAVAPTGTTRQFSVAGGRAHILGQESSAQGGYVAWSDGSENLVVGAPSGTPRVDTLLLRIYDEQYGTITGTSRAQWDIVAGTPNASPVALADSSFLAAGANYIPGAWWRVADIRSNPGDTTIPPGQIYSTNTFVRVPGGRTLCNSTASTTGFGGRPTDGVKGDSLYEIDTGYTYTHNGSKWIRDRVRLPLTSAYSNATTGFTDLAGFTFPGDINSSYAFDGWLTTVAPTANDIQLQWTLPAGATMEWGFTGAPGPANPASNTETTVWTGTTTALLLQVGGMASAGTGVRISGQINLVGTAGTCKLQAAQIVAGGTSFVRLNSWLTSEQML